MKYILEPSALIRGSVKLICLHLNQYLVFVVLYFYATIFQDLLCHRFLFVLFFCGLNLNKILLLLLTRKSRILLLLSRAGLSLKHCHKIHDVYNKHHYIILNYA